MIQTISLLNIILMGKLNGDFSSFENKNWIILIIAFIVSICPFYLLYTYLKNKNYSINYFPLGEIKYFSPIVIVLLCINVYLALKYKIGKLANYEIYKMPFYLKPFIVIINRIDAYVITGYHLISNQYPRKNNVIAIILLITLSISRASVLVFLFLILIYSSYGKFRLNLKKITFYFLLFLLTYQFVPTVFNFREYLRNGAEAKYIQISDKTELFKFTISKLTGRVSSLSAVDFYFENHKKVKKSANQSADLDFIIEFFKPFYGGFYRQNIKCTTYIFTNIYDTNALSNYGVMYALPSVFLLSYYKGIHILLINIIFITIIVIIIINLSAFLFGNVFKEFVYILLFSPIMSGVPAEFGQLLFYLLTLSVIKLCYRQFILNNKKYI